MILEIFIQRKNVDYIIKMQKIRSERKKIVEKIKSINDSLVKLGYSNEDIGLIYKQQIEETKIIVGTKELIEDLYFLIDLRKMKTHVANNIKNKLVRLLENKTEAKEKNTNQKILKMIFI